MKSKLDQLLESIDPINTYDVVSSRVDSALISFKIKTGIIDDWNEYEDEIARFFRHTQNKILNIRDFCPKDKAFDLGGSIYILKKEYGDSGEKAAFELVRTGQQGGIYTVLKKIGEHMVEDYAGRWISGGVHGFWDPLSADERWEVMDEYISKHGHLLPSELIEGSAARIRMNFVKVLEEHPRLIRKLRKFNSSP
jgi:hypothetical protein